MILAQNRHIDQKNRRNRPNISCSHLFVFLNNTPKTDIGEKTVSSTNGVGKTGYVHVTRN
jgi:hypothetical protein